MSRNSADSKTIDELFGACRRGQKENLSIILESLGDDQQESVWEALRQTTIPGFPRSWRFTLLIEASGLGHFAVVEELLKQGAQVDKRGSNNYTPLIAGAFEGHKEVVSFLLQHGADINAVDTWGETALIKAAYYKGKQDCCAVLLQHPSVDVNITAKNGETALMKGACGGHKEIVNLLLQHGADINAVSNIGKTALMQGALKGHKEVVNFLLQHGADINAADSSGYTALIKAAHYGKQNCCAVLLQHPSVELNLTSKAGDTALSLAKKRGHSQIVRMIQEASAKHQNDEEKARAEAQLKGEKENAEALIQEQLAKLEAEQAQLEEARKALEEVEKKVQVNGQSNEAEMQTMLESSELDVLAEWLSAVQLSEYYDRLVEVGIRNLGDLEDLDEIILREEVHMTRLHINRFNRSYTKLLGTPEMQNGNLVFLSHFKKEAGIDARLMKTLFVKHFQAQGNSIPDSAFFLDSDNLHKLDALTQEVAKSKNFIILLTKGIFTRPWCLVELVTATRNGCNIILIHLSDSASALDLSKAEAYKSNFQEALMQHHQENGSSWEEADEITKNCLALLNENGVTASDVQQSIQQAMSIIACEVQLSKARQRVLMAQIEEIVEKFSL